MSGKDSGAAAEKRGEPRANPEAPRKGGEGVPAFLGEAEGESEESTPVPSHPPVAALGEMLFLMTDKGNYLLSTSSFSLISLLLCNSSPAASLSMSPRKD